ncbi:MAG: class I SAM-dependent methyltransferase [Dehalococcoidia bacterium]|nr:class I SAM-dependent methyltransferase [Dehalococcoidia bacterium]
MLPLVTPNETNDAFAADFGCNKWLIDSSPKRMIFSHVYGDLVSKDIKPKGKRLKVLDIGAGVNLCQRIIAENHDLTVVDLLAHDNLDAAKKYFAATGIEFFNTDWFDVIDSLGSFDIIISNDLFPNVDQRLIEFLGKSLEKSDVFRVTMTFFNSLRYYNVKRINADEIMCLRAWSGKDVQNALTHIWPRLEFKTSGSLDATTDSLFENNRLVTLLNYDRTQLTS